MFGGIETESYANILFTGIGCPKELLENLSMFCMGDDDTLVGNRKNGFVVVFRMAPDDHK